MLELNQKKKERKNKIAEQELNSSTKARINYELGKKKSEC